MPTALNPLGEEKISRLLKKFAIPAVISMLVSSLYNMVDQVFIGWGVGLLGNAATNVMFPIPTVCLSVALLAGVGGAANYNLCSGAKQEEKGLNYIGNSLSLQVLIGIIFMLIVLIFLKPLLYILGATTNVMPYAVSYTRIIAIGIPFFVLGTGGSHLIRADRNPNYSMACVIVGAVINLVLNPIFIFAFQWGVQGSAFATIIGQAVSVIMVVWYFLKKAKMKIKKEQLRLQADLCKSIFALGIGGIIFNISIAIGQIIMNNVIRVVGPASVYGVEIPLACVGIISKVDQIFRSICIGIHQGCQPIFGFNYGAKKYERVREAYFKAATVCIIIGATFFIAFMFLPKMILALFGAGSEKYFEFGVQYFRIYLMFTIVNAIPQITSGYFTAVGNPKLATLIPLMKHIFTFIPLVLLLPMVLGLNGIMYAGAISDLLIFICSLLFMVKEIRRLKMKMKERMLKMHV